MTTTDSNTSKQLSNEDYQKTLNAIRNWPSESQTNLILTLVREKLYGDEDSK